MSHPSRGEHTPPARDFRLPQMTDGQSFCARLQMAPWKHRGGGHADVRESRICRAPGKDQGAHGGKRRRGTAGHRSGQHVLPHRLRRLVVLRPPAPRRRRGRRRAGLDRPRHGRQRGPGHHLPRRWQHPRLPRRLRAVDREAPHGLRRRPARGKGLGQTRHRCRDGCLLLHRRLPRIVEAQPARRPLRRCHGAGQLGARHQSRRPRSRSWTGPRGSSSTP